MNHLNFEHFDNRFSTTIFYDDDSNRSDYHDPNGPNGPDFSDSSDDGSDDDYDDDYSSRKRKRNQDVAWNTFAAQLLLGLKKWKVKDILDLEYVDNISSFSKEPTPNNSPIALKANFMTYCADCDLKLMAKSLKHHMSYLPSL
ncbi:hypothetical protein RhiirC2_845230 [Rhizophagus irregularis]|uniref:Uncharacterized protein n=1 Tax=Rhizophagus irregularis TaxID=588596 RepID=A0A2N1NRB2_9GLOM|nr:hypothetical protein RhiirC2_845230 [Rhizophagus irregularis]